MPPLQSDVRLLHHIRRILATSSPSSSVESSLDPLVPFFSSHLLTAVLAHSPPPLPSAFRLFNWASNRARFRSRDSHDLMVSLLLGQFDAAWACLRQIRADGEPVASHSFEPLISAYVRAGMTDEAVETFGRVEDFGCLPSVFVYNSVLSVLIKEGVFMLAMAIYNRLLKSNCSPNRTTFNILINGCCRVGKTQDALALFEEMLARGLHPDTMVFNIVVNTVCKAHQLGEAARLLDRMKQADIAKCAVTYNTVLGWLCKLGRMEEAFGLLARFEKEGFVLDLVGYNSFVHGLFKTRHFHEALAWYSTMLSQNIRPDRVFYTTMIRGCVQEGKIEDAFAFFREMTYKDDIQPDTLCYNTLIRGLCHIGKLDDARSLQLEISRNGCFPNAATHTITICGLCRQGLLVEAQQIFDEMTKQGCFPTVRTFNALINGLCKVGNLHEAQILFCRMEMGRTPSVYLRLSQNADLLHDSRRLKELIEKLCQSGHVPKAYKLLHSLSDTGIVHPNNFTYSILIDSFCKHGDFDKALNLVKDLESRGISLDTVTYGIIINGCLRKNHLEEALAIFDRMLKSGCTPSLMIYRTVMKVFCRMKNIPQAISLWLNYLSGRSGLSTKDADTIAASKEILEQGSIEVVVRHLINIDSKSGSCCPEPYCIWIIGYCRDGKPDLALKIFNILLDCNIDVIPGACSSLVHTLCKKSMTLPATMVMLYALRKDYRLPEHHGNFLLQRLLREGNEKALRELMSRISRVGYDLERYLDGRTKYLLFKVRPNLLPWLS